MSENELIKISEDEIKTIIAGNYGVRSDDVCLYHDYEFVKRGGDKVRNDYIYGIVDLRSRGSVIMPVTIS